MAQAVIISPKKLGCGFGRGSLDMYSSCLTIAQLLTLESAFSLTHLTGRKAWVFVPSEASENAGERALRARIARCTEFWRRFRNPQIARRLFTRYFDSSCVALRGRLPRWERLAEGSVGFLCRPRCSHVFYARFREQSRFKGLRIEGKAGLQQDSGASILVSAPRGFTLLEVIQIWSFLRRFLDGGSVD
jgi:hypothetical protein